MICVSKPVKKNEMCAHMCVILQRIIINIQYIYMLSENSNKLLDERLLILFFFFDCVHISEEG